MNADFDFNSFYNLAKKVFDPLTNLLYSIKVNGTSLIVVFTTVFLVILLLNFVLRLSGGGLTGVVSAGSPKKQFERNNNYNHSGYKKRR